VSGVGVQQAQDHSPAQRRLSIERPIQIKNEGFQVTCVHRSLIFLQSMIHPEKLDHPLKASVAIMSASRWRVMAILTLPTEYGTQFKFQLTLEFVKGCAVPATTPGGRGVRVSETVP
jgi:hypothetical protein